jgi:hypothetical protein
LSRMLLVAGRSTQATLHGREETTIESLYLSPVVQAMLKLEAGRGIAPNQLQLCDYNASSLRVATS